MASYRKSAGRETKSSDNIFRWSMAPKPRSPIELSIKKEPIENYYKIFWKEIVGEGVSGVVCQCESIKTGKRFVLKSLRKNEYSLREIQLHFYSTYSDNIVQIEEVFECLLLVASNVPGSSKVMCYAIVMEYMEGGDLYEFISAKGSFTEVEAAYIIRQIAEALFHLHCLNLAHRDLKPENSLTNISAKDITDEKFFTDLKVKITDFGYAKEDDHKMKSPLYTPYYVPPEVIVNDAFWPGSELHFYDKSCDMWSLGVIIYIILCGYPPFYPELDNENITTQMVEKIKQGKYSFPEDDWKEISMEAKDLVKKLLVVESKQRLTSVEVVTHSWLNSKVPNTPLSTPNNLEKMRSMSANQVFSDLREELREDRAKNKDEVIHFTNIDNPLWKKRGMT